jgi:hypothetical protein
MTATCVAPKRRFVLLRQLGHQVRLQQQARAFRNQRGYLQRLSRHHGIF